MFGREVKTKKEEKEMRKWWLVAMLAVICLAGGLLVSGCNGQRQVTVSPQRVMGQILNRDNYFSYTFWANNDFLLIDGRADGGQEFHLAIPYIEGGEGVLENPDLRMGCRIDAYFDPSAIVVTRDSYRSQRDAEGYWQTLSARQKVNYYRLIKYRVLSSSAASSPRQLLEPIPPEPPALPMVIKKHQARPKVLPFLFPLKCYDVVILKC